MTQGLRTFDEGGRLILDVTDRLTKIIGTIEIAQGETSGSGFIEHPDFLQGDPFYFTEGNWSSKGGYIDGRGWHHGMWYNKSTGLYLPALDVVARSLSVEFKGIRMEWSFHLSHSRWLSPTSGFKIIYGVY